MVRSGFICIRCADITTWQCVPYQYRSIMNGVDVVVGGDHSCDMNTAHEPMRSPYFTNTPGDQGVHKSQLDHRLYKGVSQGGVALSLTSHPSLSFHLLPTRVTSHAHLTTRSAYLYEVHRRHCSWSGVRYHSDLWASTFRLAEKQRSEGRRRGKKDMEWEMGDGRWEMGDGRWEMGDGRGEKRGEDRGGEVGYIQKQWKDYVPQKKQSQTAALKQLSIKT